MVSSFDIVPLNSAQLGIYYDQLLHPGSAMYNVGAMVVIKGRMEFARFETACRRVLDKHANLRSSVVLIHDEPTLHVMTSLSVDVQLIDLQGLGMSEVESYVDTNFQIPYDLSACSSLCNFYLIKTSDEFYVFYSKYHHIITDGWGTSIIFKDLTEFYNQEKQEQIATDFKYQLYSVEQDRKYLASSLYASDKIFWADQLSARPGRLFAQTPTAIACEKEELTIPRSIISKADLGMQAIGCSLFHAFIGCIYLVLSKAVRTENIS